MSGTSRQELIEEAAATIDQTETASWKADSGVEEEEDGGFGSRRVSSDETQLTVLTYRALVTGSSAFKLSDLPHRPHYSH